MKGTAPCDPTAGRVEIRRILFSLILPGENRRTFVPTLVLLTFLVLTPNLLRGQGKGGASADSLQVEHLVELYGPGDFLTNARRALLAQLRDKDSGRVAALLAFMPTRKGGAGWLSPAEELLARTLIVDLTFLRDREALVSLLAARTDHPGEKGGDEDNLFATMLEWLRNDPDGPLRLLKQKESGEVEGEFLMLLVDAQRISSVRRIADVNHAVDRFIETYPDSPYGGIADRYLRLYRTPAPSGAGFFLGYAFGGVVGSSSRIPGREDGPTIGGELYLKNWTAIGELMIERLALRDSFAVKSTLWQQGDGVMIGGMLGAGYEFRSGDFLCTPFLGGTFFTLNQDASNDPLSPDPSTDLQVGLALGGTATWRIPFDHGPQLDLRFRLSGILPGFGRYSSDLDGGMILAGFSFGFIGRPYRVGLKGDPQR